MKTAVSRYVANSPVNYIDPFGFFKSPVRVPIVPAPGTGTTVSPPGSAPAIGIPGINPLDLYRLNGEELKRKRDYIREFGDFPGSDNPQLWQDLPGGLPKNERFEADPLQINPDRRNDDFVNPDQPDSWFEKAKKLIEDLNQENDRKEEENNGGNHQGASCSIGDRDNYSPPESSHDNGDNDSGSQDDTENFDSNSNSFPTPEDVLKDLSNRNKKHIRQHLSDFQELDPTITEESLYDLGSKIVRPENLVSSPNADQLIFDKIIDINGNPTKVRAVLNRDNKLRSVYPIRDK